MDTTQIPQPQIQNTSSKKTGIVLIAVGTILFLGLAIAVVLSMKKNNVPDHIAEAQRSTGNTAQKPPTLEKTAFDDVKLTPAKLPVFSTPTPTPIYVVSSAVSTATSTGALLVAPNITDVVASEELFALLNSDSVNGNSFTIEPVPKERKIYIWVQAPMALNKQKAQTWLKSNGYGNIPEKNLIYMEQ